MKTLKTYNARIPSDVNSICNLVADILLYLKENLGFTDEGSFFEYRVILNELIINAVKHGNKGNCDKRVKVRVGMYENKYVYFIVRDEGEGYNFDCHIKECCEGEDDFLDCLEMKENGRGIMIVKSLCDSLKFNKRGNVAIAVKKVTR